MDSYCELGLGLGLGLHAELDVPPRISVQHVTLLVVYSMLELLMTRVATMYRREVIAGAGGDCHGIDSHNPLERLRKRHSDHATWHGSCSGLRPFPRTERAKRQQPV